MKKYIFSVLMAAMAAFTFSSCEDVPAPYTQPTQPGAPTTPEVKTEGTEASPYTVTDAKAVKTGADKYVKGFIVGYVPDKALNEAIFGDATSAEKAPTNILIAAKADEKDVNNCMPVQLPFGDIRSALNLKDNPGNLKKELLICGSIENYFGAIGLKTPVYAKVDGKEIGNKPGSTPTPDTPTTGKGSESDPYNVAEAIAVIKAGKAPTTEVYLTGIISDVAFYNEQYKSITYYISDDGKSKDMQVYSGKGLNGKDFASKEELKVGQKVTILGKIMKFTDKNGNEIMEVDKTSSIIKIEDGGSTPSTPDTPSTGKNEISISNMVSSDALPENSYGSQATATESTWFTWKSGNISYAGAKICKATEANGGGIQIQGNASDATKQGFFFNKTAFSNDIKSITIVVRGSNKYDTPTTFNVYEGTAAHPTTNKIEGKYTTAADGNFNVFTMTYDFSAVNSKYFTVWNNAVGALYIDKVIITLK